MNLLDSPELRLPLKPPTQVTQKEEETMKDPSTPTFEKENYALDIETEPFVDSPLKKLELKTIQLDDRFVKVTPEKKPYLQKSLVGRELLVFNSLFEQTQLYRNGFDIWSNDWKDVLLLAKLYDNRLAQEGIIRMFKLPSYEWLQVKVAFLKNPDWTLPLWQKIIL